MSGRTSTKIRVVVCALAALAVVAAVGGIAVGTESGGRRSADLTAAVRSAVVAAGPVRASSAGPAPIPTPTTPSLVVRWPGRGQASLDVGGTVGSSSGQTPVPIASVAKVMTAYVVLQSEPLDARLVVTAADVADTTARRARNQSVVAVRIGEVLTERQALEALLVPSANNVAVMLARQVAGSSDTFVGRMNETARSLGMTSTTYTDPSGYDAGTVSTAADQLRLVVTAMAIPAFAELVRESTAVLPVAGTVQNNDALLGTDGFVGVKTGSSYAAGGAFAFRSVRPSGRVVTGVVLGQGGGNPAEFIANGLAAGRQLADQFG